MADYIRPYLDSSVYIAAIKGPECEGEDALRAPIARSILQGAVDGRYAVVASTWIRAEVIRDRSEPVNRGPEDLTVIRGFLDHGFIEWVEVDVLLADKAQRLASDHNLKPADAVHLASAIRGHADVLLRWDHSFHEGEYEGVRVCDPFLRVGEGHFEGLGS